MNNILVEVLADRIKAGKLKMKKVPEIFHKGVQDSIDGVEKIIEPKKEKQTFELFKTIPVVEKVDIKEITNNKRNELIDKMLKDFGYIK